MGQPVAHGEKTAADSGGRSRFPMLRSKSLRLAKRGTKYSIIDCEDTDRSDHPSPVPSPTTKTKRDLRRKLLSPKKKNPAPSELFDETSNSSGSSGDYALPATYTSKYHVESESKLSHSSPKRSPRDSRSVSDRGHTTRAPPLTPRKKKLQRDSMSVSDRGYSTRTRPPISPRKVNPEKLDSLSTSERGYSAKSKKKGSSDSLSVSDRGYSSAHRTGERTTRPILKSPKKKKKKPVTTFKSLQEVFDAYDKITGDEKAVGGGVRKLDCSRSLVGDEVFDSYNKICEDFSSRRTNLGRSYGWE